MRRSVRGEGVSANVKGEKEPSVPGGCPEVPPFSKSVTGFGDVVVGFSFIFAEDLDFWFALREDLVFFFPIFFVAVG